MVDWGRVILEVWKAIVWSAGEGNLGGLEGLSMVGWGKWIHPAKYRSLDFRVLDT